MHTSALLVNYISPSLLSLVCMANSSQVPELTIPMAAVLCETFFFGMTAFPTSKRYDTEQGIMLLGVYSALFVFATFVMWCVFRARTTPPPFSISHVNGRRRSSSSLRRNALLVLSAVMYGVSASHCAINVADSLRAIRIGRFALTPVKHLVDFYLPTINVRSATSKT